MYLFSNSNLPSNTKLLSNLILCLSSNMKELVEESPNRLNHTKVQALNFGVETVQTSEEQDEDCCVQNS